MFLLNSRLGLFAVTNSRWCPFSQSYGAILPSSLTALLPPACGFSPHLPVSVYGTGSCKAIAAFLGSSVHMTSLLYFQSLSHFSSPARICLRWYLCASTGFPFPAHIPSLRPHSSVCIRYRIFNLLSIDYVFRPRLRSRLTQSRSA